MRRQMTNAIIVSSWDKGAHCLDPTNGVETKSFSTPSLLFNASQTSSSEFVMCGDNGKLSVGSMTSGIVIKTMTGHGGKTVYSVATISGRVATGGSDNMISLWDVTAGNTVSQFRGHAGVIYQLHHHPIVCPNSLFSSSYDKTVREWDLTPETSLRVFNGHSNGVYGLCLDSKHQILFSGSNDKTVKGWDLRSGNEICSLDFPNCVCSLLFREESNENQLIVPVYGEKNYIYDLRMIQQNGTTNELISWEHGHSFVFGSCDVLDQNLFVTVGFDDQQVKAWRDDGSLVWEWKGPSYLYGALSFVNDYEGFVSSKTTASFSPDSNDIIIDSLEVVKKFDDLSNVQLRCDSSSPPFELPGSLSLLSSSPYLKTTTPDLLSLDRSYPLIDEEGFFSVLFGNSPSPESLSQYYSLFRELRMFGFAFAMCELIRSTVTTDHLEHLISDCEFQPNEIMSTTVDDDNAIFSLLTPFEFELLRHIREIPISNSLFHRLNTSNGMVGSAAHAEEIPSFRDHEDFLDLFPRGETKTMTVAEAARKNLSSLLTLRQHTNVTLTTADGGEERCHLEVLITRSKFIRGMMRFEGKEYHSCLETKRIQIEDLSHAALQAWLVLCYGSEFHEMDQFSIFDLLSLLVKSHMHQESWCNRIMELLRKEINKKEASIIPSLLLEIGSQLLDLPKLYNDQIKHLFGSKSGLTKSRFDWLFNHSLDQAKALKERAFAIESRDEQEELAKLVQLV